MSHWEEQGTHVQRSSPTAQVLTIGQQHSHSHFSCALRALSGIPLFFVSRTNHALCVGEPPTLANWRSELLRHYGPPADGEPDNRLVFLRHHGLTLRNDTDVGKAAIWLDRRRPPPVELLTEAEIAQRYRSTTSSS